MSDSQKIPALDGTTPDPLDDPRLTAMALGELSSAPGSELGALDDEARREVDEIARFAESLGAALRTDEAGLDSGRRAAILAASMAASKRAAVLPLPAARARVLRRVVQWSAGGAVAAGLALTVVPNIVESRKHGNEAAAIGALKTTNSAETLFREGDKEPQTPLDYGSIAQISNTPLIDRVLGGTKQGTASGDHLYFPVITNSLYHDEKEEVQAILQDRDEPFVFRQPEMAAVPPFGRAKTGTGTATNGSYVEEAQPKQPGDTRQPTYDGNGRFLGYDTNGDGRANTDLATASSSGATVGGGGVGGAGGDSDDYLESRYWDRDRQDGCRILTREELDRQRERAVRDLNAKQRELDDLRREKNDLQDANIELARRFDAEKQRLAREKGDAFAERARLQRDFDLEQARILSQDTQLQSQIDELVARRAKVGGPLFGLGASGGLAEYGITFANGSTTNGLGVNGFFPYDPAFEKAQVDGLLRRSVDQLSVRRFDAAEATVAEVLARDPTNEEALRLRQISSEARRLLQGRTEEQLLAQGPQPYDLEVPYFPYGRVDFPDKERWTKIRARDVGVAGGEARTPEWIRDYAQVLRSRKVNLNFAETPLGEVVSFLQDITGLNIEVAPGVDQENTTVSLRLKDIPLQDALRLVLEQTKLGVDFRNEELLLGPDGAKGIAEALVKTGGKITDYELSAAGLGTGRVQIDGVWYELLTSKPTPTPSTTLEGLYTEGWRPTPLIETAKERQSTFAIDVDTASYARVRSSIRTQGRWPAASTVRVEELVNYHAYDYAPPTDWRPLAASSEVTTCPWAPDRRLVRIGLRGRGLEGAARPAANLVFLIDVSGSMGSVEKLPLVQRALTLLVSQLGERDRVSIVVYAGASGCVLDGASGADKATILGALERLQAGGSTNGGAGIELAYELCSRRFIEGGVNRVILCTDGDWNVGAQSPQALEELIARKAKGNLSLTALGFGMSEGGDRTLETLADRGDGNYAYVDGLPEARRVLVEQLDGTLVTIGKDVKVQVEWDPAAVLGYTLVGYEDRRLANQDFANDAKDAGDVGARHAVTALYEVKLATDAKTSAKTLGTLRLRWKAVTAGQAADTSELLEVPLTDDGRTLETTSVDTRFAMGVAAFALGLKAGPGPGRQLLEVAQALADGARGADPHGLRADFSELVRTARGISR